MTEAEKLYHNIAENLTGAQKSKMFGALCLKAPNGKALAMFWKDCMIFKLEKPDEEEVLKSLKGSHIFNPMGNRPMGGWVQVPYEHSKQWKSLVEKSMAYVKNLKK